MTHALALILLAGLFGAGDRFDLVCTQPGAGDQPAEAPIHVRVDLARTLYCIDDCQAGQWIPAVGDTAIVLYDGSDGGRHSLRISIVRGDSGQAELIHFWGSNGSRRAVCEIKPFSGIPGGEPLPFPQ
ncbi:MAG: hypothetical protein Q7T61_03335 [Caulobacter sp.]|nr:hypothetical protein [Caulobacter sp.]